MADGVAITIITLNLALISATADFQTALENVRCLLAFKGNAERSRL
ncbi:MAG: hypothetical protein JF588_01695 [Caulobacterales bacterium]|nr:hypothetical protein [Caulobacterales bacterium]